LDLDRVDGGETFNFVVKVKELVSVHEDPEPLVLAVDLDLSKQTIYYIYFIYDMYYIYIRAQRSNDTTLVHQTAIKS